MPALRAGAFSTPSVTHPLNALHPLNAPSPLTPPIRSRVAKCRVDGRDGGFGARRGRGVRQ
jgi:hypothetical protein